VFLEVCADSNYNITILAFSYDTYDMFSSEAEFGLITCIKRNERTFLNNLFSSEISFGCTNASVCVFFEQISPEGLLHREDLWSLFYRANFFKQAIVFLIKMCGSNDC